MMSLVARAIKTHLSQQKRVLTFFIERNRRTVCPSAELTSKDPACTMMVKACPSPSAPAPQAGLDAHAASGNVSIHLAQAKIRFNPDLDPMTVYRSYGISGPDEE